MTTMERPNTSNIWADLDNLQAVEIGSRSSLQRLADGIRGDTFSDLEKNREFLRWFFSQAPSVGTEQQICRILDDLFCYEDFPNKASVIQWLENWKLDDFFLYLENENKEPYLMDGCGDFRAPSEFLKDAEDTVVLLPAEKRGMAMVLMTLNCMALSRVPSKLPSKLRKAMLVPWKCADTDTDYELKDEGEIFPFSWKNLPEGTVPKLRILKNTGDTARKIHIDNPDQGRLTVMIPPGGRVAAWFADKTMTNFKGSLCANGSHVACLMQDKLWQYETKWQTTRLADADDCLDASLHSNGLPHVLVGNTVSLKENGKKTISNAMGIWAREDVWVVHMEDGCTKSNRPDLRRKDVLAVVRTPETLLVLTRDGTVTAMNGRMYTPDAVWNAMAAPFSNLKQGDAERLEHNGQTFRYTEKGNMVCP
ncbi:MAG: hypothetical protein IKA16_01845 [Oscillospiraceae bacterium]|nr:hypothetical protein [Oscillospiraceae bacterium]